jgi:hypothetical protein
VTNESTDARLVDAAEPSRPNKGGRPSNEARLARRLAEARKTAMLGLLRTMEDPNTPAAVLVQATGQLERIGALDQVDEKQAALLEELEKRVAELERTAPRDPRIH